MEWSVIEPSKLNSDVADTSKNIIAAFWWVGVTSPPREANMEFTFKEVRGVRVPLLKNHVVIEPNVRLLCYEKQPVVKQYTAKKSKLA